MTFLQFEAKVNEIRTVNKKYLDSFYHHLVQDGLSEKTIKNHIANIDFYINEFLCYYEPNTIEMGCYKIDEFLGDWFIRKAMWSSKEYIKSNCSSIKKFYAYMLECGIITGEDYNHVVNTIKIKKDSWLEQMDEYMNYDEWY